MKNRLSPTIGIPSLQKTLTFFIHGIVVYLGGSDPDKVQILNKISNKYSTPHEYLGILNVFQGHQKQNIMYRQSKTRFIEAGLSFMQKECSLPLLLVGFIMVKFLFKNPVYMNWYIGIVFVMIILSKFSSRVRNKWEVAKSSKELSIREANYV